MYACVNFAFTILNYIILYCKNITNFKCLENAVKQYNEYLDKLPFLEEVM